jgi:DNA gyrase subunit A
MLTLTSDENISTIVAIREFTGNQFLFMATAKGVVKKVAVNEFSRAKTRGIIAIRLDEGDTLVGALLTSGKDEIMLVSQDGQALRIDEGKVRSMGRSGRGVTGIRLGKDDTVAGLLQVVNEEKMLILTRYGFGKRLDFSEYSPHGRGTGGQKIYTLSEKTGKIVGAVNVLDDEEIVCITSQGKSIKINASSIRVMGRSAHGVKVLTIDKNDSVIGVDRVKKYEI